MKLVKFILNYSEKTVYINSEHVTSVEEFDDRNCIIELTTGEKHTVLATIESVVADLSEASCSQPHVTSALSRISRK